MALHEDLLALIKVMSPEDQAVYTRLAEAYPKAFEGHLRQADYDRLMNKAKADVDAANAEAKKWKDWGAESKPKHDKLLAEWPKLEKERDDLLRKVEEATAAAARVAAGEGDDVKPEQISAIVTERAQALFAEKGFVTQADVNKLTKEAVAEAVKEPIKSATDKFLNETFPQTVNFTMDAVDVLFQHYREFPDVPLDRLKLSEFMKANNILSPKEGYEKFIGPERQKREIAKKVEEGVKAEMAKRNMPGVSSPGASDMGPLQIKLQDKDPLAGKTVELGDGQASNAAAAEFRAEGKF